MTNTEARKITFNECKVKCVACEEDCENMLIGECRKRLEALEQEPKIGHWIDIDSESFEFYRVYKCSECGNTEIEYPERICSHFKYCPDCGAKMESEV